MATTWKGGPGSWFDPTLWSAGVIPAASDSVVLDAGVLIGIDRGGTAQANDIALTDPSGVLNIDGALDLGGTLALDAGVLVLDGALTGGTVEAAGGTVYSRIAAILNHVTWIGPLTLAEGAGEFGNYTFNGGLTLLPQAGGDTARLVLLGNNVPTTRAGAVPQYYNTLSVSFSQSQTLDHVAATLAGVGIGVTGSFAFGSSAEVDLVSGTNISASVVSNAGVIGDSLGNGSLSAFGTLINSGVIEVQNLSAVGSAVVNDGYVIASGSISFQPSLTPFYGYGTGSELPPASYSAPAEPVENAGTMSVAAGGSLVVGQANPATYQSNPVQNGIAGAAFVNSGAISVGDGGSAVLHLNSFANSGTMSVGANGTLALDFDGAGPYGGFVNTGTISLGAGASLDLLIAGVFTLAQLGSIVASGATVHVGGGTLDLGGQTITLGATGLFGHVTFGNALTIADGTVVDLSTAPVLGTTTLDHVQWVGPLAFGAADGKASFSVSPPFNFYTPIAATIGAGVSVTAADGISTAVVAAPAGLALNGSSLDAIAIDDGGGLNVFDTVTLGAAAGLGLAGGISNYQPAIGIVSANGTLDLLGTAYLTNAGTADMIGAPVLLAGALVIPGGASAALDGTLAGSGTVDIESSGTLDVAVNGTVGDGLTVAFRDATGTLSLATYAANAAVFHGFITGFATGDVILLPGSAVDAVSGQGGQLTLLAKGQAISTLDFAGGAAGIGLTTDGGVPALVTSAIAQPARSASVTGAAATLVSAGGTVSPFSAMGVTDPIASEIDSLTVTLSTAGDGFLTGATLGAQSVGPTTRFTAIGNAAALSQTLQTLLFTANPGTSAVTTTQFTVSVATPTGTATTTTGSVTEVRQFGSLGTLDPAGIVVAASPDGSSFAAPVPGQVNEAVALAPAVGADVFLPEGEQAGYLGGSDAATLSDPNAALGTTGSGALLVANSGNDELYAAGSGDTLLGGAGADTLVALGAATISAAASTGKNLIFGGSGTTSIMGSARLDTIIAGSGATTISAGYGGEIVLGSGADSLSAGSDTIIGGSGAASISAGNGSLVVLGTGPALVTETGPQVTVVGGSGADTVSIPSNNLNNFAGVVFGSSTSTVLTSIYANLTFAGGTGSDTIYAGGGGVIQGGSAGHNMIDIAANALLLPSVAFGGGDGDVLAATSRGLVQIFAGTGAETLVATGQEGELVGGSGSDMVFLAGQYNTLTMGTGSATVYASGANDFIDFDARLGASQALIAGFDPTKGNVLHLSGYAPGTAAAALASAQTANGSETLSLPDGTRITLVGFTGLTSAMFG